MPRYLVQASYTTEGFKVLLKHGGSNSLGCALFVPGFL
jgi:hypothetical protein